MVRGEPAGPPCRPHGEVTDKSAWRVRPAAASTRGNKHECVADVSLHSTPEREREREGGRERDPCLFFFFSLNARQRGDGANSLLSSALLADRRAAFFFLFPYPIRSSDASTAANLRVLLLEKSRTHTHTHTHTRARARSRTHVAYIRHLA